MNDAPIGIFDSGVGGLTVARAVLDQLPHEPVRLRRRHRPRPVRPAAARRGARVRPRVMDHLVDEGVKVLVIACNSASAAMLRDARERYDVPVVEVILPAVRRAVRATRNGRVGVIGTPATITSGAYDDAFAAAPHLELHHDACPRFVEFVEAGVTRGPELLDVAHEYLDPLAPRGVDTLVLGCTHYPLLTGVISYVMGEDVTLSRSAEETAKDVYRTLVANDLLRDPACPSRSTGSWPPATPPLPAPRPAVPRPRDRRQRRGRSREAHRRRLRRLLPGAGLAGLVLPRRARRACRIVLDLGNGALGALQRYVDPLDDRPAAVVLSHLHADHCVDLASLYVHAPVPPDGDRAAAGARPGRHRASASRRSTTCRRRERRPSSSTSATW